MKKTLRNLFLGFLVLFLGTLIWALRYPQAYFQSVWIEKLLHRESFSKNWKWDELQVGLRSDHFLRYQLTVHAKEFSVDTQTKSLQAQGLIHQIEADLQVQFGFHGMQYKAIKPLLLKVENVDLVLSEDKTPSKRKKKSEPFDLKAFLTILNSSVVPDFDVSAKHFTLSQAVGGKTVPTLSLSDVVMHSNEALTLSTKAHFTDSLQDMPFEFRLDDNTLDARFTLAGLPYTSALHCFLSLHDLKQVKKPSPLSGQCRGALNTGPLVNGTIIELPSEVSLQASVSPTLEIKKTKVSLTSTRKQLETTVQIHYDEDLLALLSHQDQILKELLLNADLHLKIPDLNKFLATFPKGFRSTPTPLNIMNGPVTLDVTSHKDPQLNTQAVLGIDLSDRKLQQHFKMQVQAKMPWTFRPNEITPSMGDPEIELSLQKLVLMLPRISIREPLPGLMQDSRIRSSKHKALNDDVTMTWNMNLATDQPVVLRTSLFKSTPFRLAFHFKIDQDGLDSGHLELLPVETQILKRPIAVQKMQLDWPKNQAGLIDGKLLFKLPEYKIYLKVAGPINAPRAAFESDPPLATNDIYSVLLFGRPMADLDPDGRETMGRVKQGLSQGFFSLSTLYLLSGTPIESIGYNADTGDVSAQIRLGGRNSLTVGTADGGRGTVALRRSLGRGWYIESQAQEAKNPSDSSTNFGLMLERVIAY